MFSQFQKLATDCGTGIGKSGTEEKIQRYIYNKSECCHFDRVLKNKAKMMKFRGGCNPKKTEKNRKKPVPNLKFAVAFGFFRFFRCFSAFFGFFRFFSVFFGFFRFFVVLFRFFSV